MIFEEQCGQTAISRGLESSDYGELRRWFE
jgi:hypothetical protein